MGEKYIPPSRVNSNGNFCSQKCHYKWESLYGKNKKGTHLPKDIREKIRKTLMGHTVSQETRDKIRKKLTVRELSTTHKENIIAGLKTHYVSIEGKRVTNKCSSCGKEIEVIPSRYNKNWECSDCRKAIVVPCDTCGKSVKIYRSQKRKHTFCKDNNKECYKVWHGNHVKGNTYNKYKRHAEYFTTNCEWCGKIVKKEEWKKKDRSHFFCDSACKAKWVGATHRGENNPSYVERIKTTCIKCGKEIELLPCRYKKLRTCEDCRGKWAQKSLAETTFEEIYTKHNLPIVYTGDGTYKIGKLKPDFVCVDKNVAIEIFGEIYHSPLLASIKRRKIKPSATYGYRLNYYKNRGWNMIAIWSRDVTEPYVLNALKGVV